MSNMHNFNPSDFPDSVSNRGENAPPSTPLAATAIRQEADLGAPNIAPRPGQTEDGSKSSPINFDVHPEGVPERNVYGTPLGVAATTTREDGVPLLGSQSRPGPESKSEQSFWKRFRTPLIAGTAALTAVGLTVAVLNPFGKKETTDTENAGATPPAATADSLGVDAPKTSSINTAEGTATIQAQPSTEQRDGQGAGDPQGTQEALPSPLTGSIDPNKVDPTFSPESSKTLNVTINGEQVKLHTLPVLAPNASQAEADNYFNRVMELQSAALTIYLQNPQSPDFATVMDALTDDPTLSSQFVEDAQQLQAEVPAGSKPVVVIHDGADMPAHFRVGIAANNGTGKIDWSDPQTGATYISKTDGTGGVIVDVVDGKKYDWGQVPDANVEPFARKILTGVRASQMNNVGDGTSTLKYYRTDEFDPNN